MEAGGVDTARVAAAVEHADIGLAQHAVLRTQHRKVLAWHGLPLAVRCRVLVAAGWKPGFSTDFDAVVLAERFEAKTVINLSNIAQVYTDDPKKNPDARPLEAVSWPEFQKIVGTEWNPGLNAPFDPVATKKAAELGLSVYVAAGSDLPNLDKILRGQPFFGTVIGDRP